MALQSLSITIFEELAYRKSYFAIKYIIVVILSKLGKFSLTYSADKNLSFAQTFTVDQEDSDKCIITWNPKETMSC